MKTRTLTVQIAAQLEVDYNPDELGEKTFREFKAGVERVVKAELLPAFSADKDCRITLGTISYPSTKKLTLQKKGRVNVR